MVLMTKRFYFQLLVLYVYERMRIWCIYSIDEISKSSEDIEFYTGGMLFSISCSSVASMIFYSLKS